MGGARLTRCLLRCGVVAGPVFLATAAVEGLRRPDYQARRHPVSSLALGPRGWVQVGNFVLSGVLGTAFAAGLGRAAGEGARSRPGDRWGVARAGGTAALPRTAPALIALAAAGMLACGAFPADPVNGYPPGTPPTPERMTRAGITHLIASSAIMVGVPATTALDARSACRSGDRRWARISGAATGLIGGAFACACAGFGQVAALPAVAGLLQRVAVATGFAWMGAIAVRTLRELPR